MPLSLSLEILGTLFDSLPVGIVVLDPAGRVIVFNKTEELLAGRRREDVLGREFFREVAPCLDVRELGGAFRDRIGREKLDLDLEASFPFPQLDRPRDVRIKLSSFEVQGAPFAFLMIEDISRQRSIERMRETLQGFLVHDLKNPLSSVIGNLEFLRAVPQIRDIRDAEEAIVESIDAAARMKSMLVNLLDIARLETNVLPLVREPVELASLLDGVAGTTHGAARLHGAELSVDCAPRLFANIDGSLARRAVENLVDNSLRHAKRVTLRGRLEGEAAILDVDDDGPGVPPALREQIFEKYAQVVQSGPHRESHNRGLGLTFVRLAARAHGGDAYLDCPAAGGSRFRLVLPQGGRPAG